MNNLKVWLSLTHFPIENDNELKKLRDLLPQFLKNVQRCYSAGVLSQDEKIQLCNDILNTITSNIKPELVNAIFQCVSRPENRTLDLERNALQQMSLRLVQVFLIHQLNVLNSSFQHYDLLKRTEILTQTYNHVNSMINRPKKTGNRAFQSI